MIKLIKLLMARWQKTQTTEDATLHILCT